MRPLIATATVILMTAGCSTASDQVLAERIEAISAEGCEAVGWEATSDATSDLPDGGRTHTLTADGHEAACGFGTHTWQRTDEQATETSPAAVLVVTRRSSTDPPFVESDLVAHGAKQLVSGAGRAEATQAQIYPEYAVVVAVNEAYVGDLPPEQLLETARRDLGLAE